MHIYFFVATIFFSLCRAAVSQEEIKATEDQDTLALELLFLQARQDSKAHQAYKQMYDALQIEHQQKIPKDQQRKYVQLVTATFIDTCSKYTIKDLAAIGNCALIKNDNIMRNAIQYKLVLEFLSQHAIDKIGEFESIATDFYCFSKLLRSDIIDQSRILKQISSLKSAYAIHVSCASWSFVELFYLISLGKKIELKEKITVYPPDFFSKEILFFLLNLIKEYEVGLVPQEDTYCGFFC